MQIQVVGTRMKAKGYVELLQRAQLKEEGQRLCGEQWQFQQDNARIHVAGLTKAFFRRKGIRIMEWPPYSPDLNCMENAWGWMAQSVYSNGRQFNSVDELREAIFKAWDDMSQESYALCFTA